VFRGRKRKDPEDQYWWRRDLLEFRRMEEQRWKRHKIGIRKPTWKKLKVSLKILFVFYLAKSSLILLGTLVLV
jgi:hypothetical protein